MRKFLLFVKNLIIFLWEVAFEKNMDHCRISTHSAVQRGYLLTIANIIWHPRGVGKPESRHKTVTNTVIITKEAFTVRPLEANLMSRVSVFLKEFNLKYI